MDLFPVTYLSKTVKHHQWLTFATGPLLTSGSNKLTLGSTLTAYCADIRISSHIIGSHHAFPRPSPSHTQEDPLVISAYTYYMDNSTSIINTHSHPLVLFTQDHPVPTNLISLLTLLFLCPNDGQTSNTN